MRITLKLLLCFFFLSIGINTWASVSWVGSTKVNFSYTGDYTQIGSTTVWIKANGITYNTSYRGIRITSKTNIYLQAKSYDGVVVLVLEGGGSYNNNDVTLKEGSNTIISTHVSGGSSTSGGGTEIVFEMKKDTEYTMFSSQLLYIKKVTFYSKSECITLDETVSNNENNSLIANNPSRNICLTKRTLKAGQWNTFCLPLTISPAYLAEYLKCNAVYEMSSYNQSNHTITFTPTHNSNNQTLYVSCRPCLVKPTEDVINPIFHTESPVKVTETNLIKESNGLSFVGVLGSENIYTTGDANSTKFYLNNDGRLVYPTSNSGTNGTIKGLRAYFEFADGANAAELALIFDNSESDGISTIERGVKLDDNRVYSLDGRLIGTTSDNLPRGIYIQNGHKFVVNK